MNDEQSRIIEAVKFAIRMEIDGKKFYTLAGKESQNKVGKDLFSWLASQEDLHRKRFEEIYRSLEAKKAWPAGYIKPAGGQNPGTLFAKAIRDLGTAVKAGKPEFEAIGKALEMEIKSRDYYTTQAGKSSVEIERNFFSVISAEEQGHYLALVDYQEYLEDPVGWFTRTEHHLLDGE